MIKVSDKNTESTCQKQADNSMVLPEVDPDEVNCISKDGLFNYFFVAGLPTKNIKKVELP